MGLVCELLMLIGSTLMGYQGLAYQSDELTVLSLRVNQNNIFLWAISSSVLQWSLLIAIIGLLVILISEVLKKKMTKDEFIDFSASNVKSNIAMVVFIYLTFILTLL